MKLLVRELQKAFLQYLLLPFVYRIFSYQKVDNNFVILADSKSDGIPFSLQAMHKELQARNYNTLVWCHNYDKLNVFQKLAKSILFMKYYARAKYVFICDYYLPVSSCNKKEETKVVQLWHASGLQKKFGYDAPDDLGNLRWINPTKNFDLVSVSSEIMVNVVSNNWRMDKEKVKALGHSRSDFFFEEGYVERCEKQFYEEYPAAKGKTVILWAPSFRGNGSNANIDGIEEMLNLKERLNDDYFLVIKLHPHLQEKYKVDNCKIKTEELYPVTDILITDYSSVFYDFLLLKKKVIFYVPDYEEYTEARGMYIDYRSEFNFPMVYETKDLFNVICRYNNLSDMDIDKYRGKFINCNDGLATKRILDDLDII
ncbi:MAG: CDP-glycerol glycerophosphotransferase family protein [Phascolarctobacterium sp.]|nr:CDP-glycerol glycerophosphotransferase family protein [Phascolarctobacterium sp.]